MGDARTRTVDRRWAGAGVVVALLAAVVLVRGGSAATGDDLAGPTGAPTPTGTTTGTTTGTPTDGAGPTGQDGGADAARLAAEQRLDPDGIGRVRLGGPGSTLEDGAGGRVLVPAGESDDGRCTLLRPTTPSAAGLDLLAWEVDGVVVAVGATAPDAATPATTSLGVGFGDDLAVPALLPGAVRSREEVAGAATGPVGWVVAEVDGVEVLASDLGGTVGVQHLEVRAPEGRSCRSSTPWERPPVVRADAGAGLPVLDAAGRGPVRWGQPVEELPALGLEESPSFTSYDGCDLWYPGRGAVPGTEGLGAVWLRDGRVVGIEVAEGALAEGVATGDDLPALFAAFPELDVDAVDPLAVTPFPRTMTDGRTIDVVLLDTWVVPSEVDALLPTDRPLVASVTLWTEECLRG